MYETPILVDLQEVLGMAAGSVSKKDGCGMFCITGGESVATVTALSFI